MLPKANKLTKKKDFDAVFKKGKTSKHGFLMCKVAKNNLKYLRVGFMVSKKVSKKAVVRNKLRRQLSAIFYKNRASIKAPADMVVMAYPEAAGKTFTELESAVQQCLKSL